MDGGKLKLINFLGVGTSSETTSINNVKLQIEQTEDKEIFPEGLKFTFKDINSDITVKSKGEEENKTITLKQGTNPEFKIKKQDGKYYLESAWSPINLLSKAVKNCEISSTTNESKCTLKNESKINLWKGENDYVIGATLGSGQTDKKIIFANNIANYNQGFKFTADSDTTLDVSKAILKKPSLTVPDDWKLEKTSVCYEVAIKTIEDKKEWFLVKKS